MTRFVPNQRDVIAGYSLLPRVALTTGRHDGSGTIFVLLVLAETLNATRRVLYILGARRKGQT